MTADEQPRGTANRSTLPDESAFTREIRTGWAERESLEVTEAKVAGFAAERRRAIGAMHPGSRIIIPAGDTKVRSNDTDYRFRPHSAFTHMTGWGSDAVPGAVLVLEPVTDDASTQTDGDAAHTHEATLYFRERAGRDTPEFYENPAIGEFWTGPRPALGDIAALLRIRTAHIRDLNLESAHPTVVLREPDPLITGAIDAHRSARLDADIDRDLERDAQLETNLSELRLVKDAYEIDELKLAVEATGRGFDDIIRSFDRAVEVERGERVVETAFFARARLEGNDLGYDTIAAAGPHACYLHWIRNDGPVRPGELMLVDAGVEVDSLYTADITRTLPVNGRFTEVQRRVYEAVREAADRAFAIVRPGILFLDVHEEAMQSIAETLTEWGIIPHPLDEVTAPDGQHHRRFMVHGTSHHLGLDVHDCAAARREMYRDGEIKAGMTFTIEPGLYFHPDDLTVPEEYRGIGVRIEDDILVTEDGAENLSAFVPRTAADVEAWMERLR